MATVLLETLEIILVGMKCDIEEEREVVTSVSHSHSINHHLGSTPVCFEEPAALLRGIDCLSKGNSSSARRSDQPSTIHRKPTHDYANPGMLSSFGMSSIEEAGLC